jgi:hypothetical protein
LLAEFPDNRRLQQYYTSRVIAPRFFVAMIAEYRKALAYGSSDEKAMAYRDLCFIVPKMRLFWRLIITPMLPLLAIRPLARVILSLRVALPDRHRRQAAKVMG